MDDVEPADEEPSENTLPVVAGPKGRRSFISARRELTDEEMSSSGVAKMLLDEIERLESDCASLKSVFSQFHTADKRVGVLEEQLKQRSAFETLTNGALAIGAALFGFAPFVWDSKNYIVAVMIGVLGIALTVVGFLAKGRSK